MLRYQLIHFLLLCRIQITYCFISNATALIASEYVKEQLYRRGAHNVDDRLAVIILKSSLDEFESKEAIVNSELFKCVELLSQHVADTTPLITYIFTRSTSAQVKENFKTNFTDIFLNANLILMYIEDSDWTLPKGRARNQALWVGSTRFTQDYRLMGTWRLAFPFMFSKFVGHKYFLFLDSDSFFSKSVGYNFITKMNEGNRKLGFIRLTNDNPLVTKGLPELAKYFILSRNFEPTLLYQDCTPQSIDGVYSSTSISNDKKLGWHRTCIYGNFVIYRTDFWFESLVQDFLELVLYTQDQIILRWNEQAVLGIMRLMFIRKEDEIRFIVPGYCHKLGELNSLRLMRKPRNSIGFQVPAILALAGFEFYGICILVVLLFTILIFLAIFVGMIPQLRHKLGTLRIK